MVLIGERDLIFATDNAWTAFCQALKKEFKALDAEQFARDKLWNLVIVKLPN